MSERTRRTVGAALIAMSLMLCGAETLGRIFGPEDGQWFDAGSKRPTQEIQAAVQTGIVSRAVGGGQEENVSRAAGGDQTEGDREGRLNVNTATAEELTVLPGIGPTLAGRIVAERTENGPFCYPEDLMTVSGIGTHKLAAILDLVCTE